MLVALIFPLALANEVNKNAYLDRSGDVFDKFDNDLNGFITIDDLRIMNDYTHIWTETKQGNGTMTHGDLSEHKGRFADLWTSIIGTFEGLNKNNDEFIDMADFQKVEHELDLATDAMHHFENEFINAGIMLGQEPDEITISFEQLNNMNEKSQQIFSERLDAAFHRLGGSEEKDVPNHKFQEYNDEVALLWTVMESLMDQKDADNPAVQKKDYVEKLEDLGIFRAKKAAEVKESNAHLQVGQRSREENGLEPTLPELQLRTEGEPTEGGSTEGGPGDNEL